MHQVNYIEQQPKIFHILIEIKFLLLKRKLKNQIISIIIEWQRMNKKTYKAKDI